MLISDWSSDVCSSDLHVADQRRRGGHDRPHHDRVLNETADEHAPRSEKALELRANPMRRRDLRVLGVRPRIGHDGFRIVAASFVGGKIGRQAQGKIWAWRWTDRTSRVGRGRFAANGGAPCRRYRAPYPK